MEDGGHVGVGTGGGCNSGACRGPLHAAPQNVSFTPRTLTLAIHVTTRLQLSPLRCRGSEAVRALPLYIRMFVEDEERNVDRNE